MNIDKSMIIIILITVTYNIITMVTEVHFLQQKPKQKMTRKTHPHQGAKNNKHLLTKVHGTASPDGQSLGVGDPAVRIEPNEPVSFSLKQMNLLFLRSE